MVDKIFAELATHMITGMMIHDNLANYYWFLGCEDYAKCHEQRFQEESCGFRRLNEYYVTHHNRLIPDLEIDTPLVIPESWYKVTRFDVDDTMRKTAVKNGLSMWHKWEKDTKALYERMFKELSEMGEVASAMFVKCYVCDVDRELAMVEGYVLEGDKK